MPLKVDPRDRKLLIAAAILFVLMIAAAAVFGGGAGEKLEAPSSYSTASGGAKAAYLLLEDAGIKVRRWEKSLDQLPQGAMTLVLAEPTEAPTRGERDGLAQFLKQGGRVIATGMFAGTFLPENRSLPDLIGGMTWKKASSISPSKITRAAPEITIAPEAQWESYAAAYPLYGDEDRILVVKYPYGRGEVLWWASATPLTNAGLKERGNLEFFLACMSETKGEVLWDEYVHGYRETLGSSIAHSPVKWLVLQLAILGMAVLATYSRRSGPTCQPVTEVRLSPLEFVQTLGGLYERAGTASVAVDICYQRFRYWLTRRLGMAGNVSISDLESAVRERWGLEDRHFAGVLGRCESAKNDPYLQEPEALHLVKELDGYATKLRLFEGGRKENGE